MSYQNANMIMERMWIGDVKSSVDRGFMRDNKIDVIVNCTKDLMNMFEPYAIKDLPREVEDEYFIKYFRVACNDNGREEEVDNFLNDTKKIMDEVVTLYKEGKTLLIHCAAGQQRSCSFALCFLNRLGYEKKEGYKMIREKREAAFNYGNEMHFGRAINMFE